MIVVVVVIVIAIGSVISIMQKYYLNQNSMNEYDGTVEVVWKPFITVAIVDITVQHSNDFMRSYPINLLP